MKKHDNTIYIDMFMLFVITIVVSVSVFYPNITGKAVSDYAEPGTVNQLNLEVLRVEYWHGVTGEINPMFTKNWTRVGENYFEDFNVMLPECDRATIYVTELREIDWDRIEPAKPELLDDYYDIPEGNEYTARLLFTDGRYFNILGERKLLRAVKTQSPSNAHYTGIMKQDNTPIYITTFFDDLTSFQENIVDYQIMVGVKQGRRERMYFFMDPISRGRCINHTEIELPKIEEGEITQTPQDNVEDTQISETTKPKVERPTVVKEDSRLFWLKMLCLFFLLVDIEFVAIWFFFIKRRKKKKENEDNESKQPSSRFDKYFNSYLDFVESIMLKLGYGKEKTKSKQPSKSKKSKQKKTKKH